MMNQNLQYYIQKNGGPEAHLFMGSKITERIVGKINFERFYYEFRLEPSVDNPEQIQLEWKQRHWEQPFLASQLSDGILRFACLVTALIQPKPLSTIIIDEPELGLHPYALALLADLIKQAATHTQIIVATQSATLLDYFEPGDIIVIDREDESSVFKRLEAEQLKTWLEDYTLGELWQKNVFGGRA